MKIFIFIFLLLSLPLPTSAVTLIGSGVGAGCSTPQDGSELNEGFLGAGAENTWTEVEGSGATLDLDFTLSGDPEYGSCSEGMNVDIPISNGNETLVKYTFAADITYPIELYFVIYLDSITLGNYEAFDIVMSIDNAETGIGFRLVLFNDSGTTSILVANGDDSSYSTPQTFSLDTKHIVKVRLDATRADSYLQLDDGSEYTFTRDNAAFRKFLVGVPWHIETDEAVDIEFGRVEVDKP